MDKSNSNYSKSIGAVLCGEKIVKKWIAYAIGDIIFLPFIRFPYYTAAKLKTIL